MNKKIFIIFWIIVAILVFVLRIEKAFSPVHESPTAEINNYIFNLDIADDIDEMERGLSGRDALADNQAMLFVYDADQQVSFWMKDMKFDIDLLWIQGDKVVGFEKNMKAPSEGMQDYQLKVYKSPQVIDKVLEIRSGKVDELNIKKGDIINLNL